MEEDTQQNIKTDLRYNPMNRIFCVRVKRRRESKEGCHAGFYHFLSRRNVSVCCLRFSLALKNEAKILNQLSRISKDMMPMLPLYYLV